MSNTEDKRYTEIEVPELNTSSYGENLKNQFEVINNNFARLSTSDFMKGESGDSVEFVIITRKDIINHEEKESLGLADKAKKDIKWLLINNIKLQLLKDAGLTSINIEDANISDICIICKKDVLNQSIALKFNKDIFDLIKDIYISPIYVFNKKIANDAQNNTSENYKDFTGVYMYKINQFLKSSNSLIFSISGSKNLISNSAYYDDGKKCICWRINGYDTGIPIQGPAGADGTAGKIYIGTYEGVEDNYTKNLEIINNSDKSVNLTGNPVVLTERNGYKTYISYLEKVGNTNEYKAEIQSTQDITKLFTNKGLLIPFASDPDNFKAGFTISSTEGSNKHVLQFGKESAESDKNGVELSVSGVSFAADSIWTAGLTTGNNNSTGPTATVYKGLKLIQDDQAGQKEENFLTADNDGFYVANYGNPITSDNIDSISDNRIVIKSELKNLKKSIDNELENYYIWNDNDITKLIDRNASKITEQQSESTIINGTVISKGAYDKLNENESKLNNHLYFIYEG